MNNTVPDYILSQLGISLSEYNIIVSSGYHVEVTTNMDNNLMRYSKPPICRIILQSDISKPSLTYTNHDTHNFDVTESVLKMIYSFRQLNNME